jgi:bis(5'-adenosyl)-triphosphatase
MSSTSLPVSSCDSNNNNNNTSTTTTNSKLVTTPKLQEGDVQFGKFIIPSASVFYRTELSCAFVNLRPLVPGHVLVISNTKPIATTLNELSDTAYIDLWTTVRYVQTHVLAKAYPTTSAYNVAIQDGRAAGQSVPHVHVHILPRHGTDRYNIHNRNDDIYTDLELWAPREATPQEQPSSLQVPDDEQRRDRTLQEMADEAATYRKIVQEQKDEPE